MEGGGQRVVAQPGIHNDSMMIMSSIHNKTASNITYTSICGWINLTINISLLIYTKLLLIKLN